MKIDIVKSLDTDIDLIKTVGLHSIKNVYLIQVDGVICGVIEYHIPSEYSLKIEYITIFDEHKRKGIATKCINLLKDNFKEHEIYGDSLPFECSVGFWKSIGGELEDEQELEEYKQNNECIPFVIY